MLDSILGYLVTVIWIVISVATVYHFLRIWYRHSLKRAVALLISRRFIFPFLFVIGITFINAGVVFVYPQYIAVIISIWEKDGLRPQPVTAGLHWVWPLIEKPVLYPIFWQTYTMSRTPYEGQRIQSDPIVARTLDSQEVKMDFSIIYRLDPEQIVELHRYWQNRYTEEMIRPGVRAIVRREVSHYTVDEVNSDKRNELADLLDANLKHIAAENGIIIKRVLLRNISFSSEYSRSVEYKQVALEGEIQKQHEARQIENLAKGKAQKIELLAKAEAEAVRIRAQANADARLMQAKAEAQALQLVADALQNRQNLLTYRYIEKLSPNVQAVVLPHDMPLIFPLPDMQPPAQTLPLPLSDDAVEVGQN
jgi:regulator of protease activity HflC (stomatin/prohibitin superfamily)